MFREMFSWQNGQFGLTFSCDDMDYKVTGIVTR